ncbi:UDP-N-acetylmuramate dehydrogenase [Lunatibacter salilacus]|uniref:UDP-N-acetylmuramate dehydrogenase n=1 Tax=Lunatibacter salilacus TaxID=2483804 RepID=UPI00131E0F11|nr:UDP-N-acetylmuramate dehydrogenase [Lunatibacter salilacus]
MKIAENLDLTSYNSYKIKANCKVAYFPESEEDIVSFFTEYKDFILLGSGHNIIFSKEYYEKPILLFSGNFNNVKVVNEVLEIEAGAMMWDVAQKALEVGLSGVEIFYDIPSSLGGAIVMNAGASGEEIKDVLVKVRYLDLADLQIKEIFKEEMSFEYRNSFFQRNTDKIVLKAWLKLQKREKNEIKEKMELVKTQRWAKQPNDFPNAGSVFKRPPGYYVGALIDELQMKGFAIGGAKISEKHGGFIINFNNASGSDILEIIKEVKKRVYNLHQVELEVEQRVI